MWEPPMSMTSTRAGSGGLDGCERLGRERDGMSDCHSNRCLRPSRPVPPLKVPCDLSVEWSRPRRCSLELTPMYFPKRSRSRPPASARARRPPDRSSRSRLLLSCCRPTPVRRGCSSCQRCSSLCCRSSSSMSSLPTQRPSCYRTRHPGGRVALWLSRPALHCSAPRHRPVQRRGRSPAQQTSRRRSQGCADPSVPDSDLPASPASCPSRRR